MTTIRQIITDAYRESGIIQIGTTPEAEQFDEALRRLQTIVSSLVGHEAGENFSDQSFGSNNYAFGYQSYYVPGNVRLFVNDTAIRTVYLNPEPQAGARFSVVDVNGDFATTPFTVLANGRKIEGSDSVTLNTDGTNTQWFYRDDLAEWVKVTDIDADEESPFPSEFDDFLIISLAMRLHPRYQQQTAQETLIAWKRAKSQFRARYKQTRNMYPDTALVRLSSRFPGITGYDGPASQSMFDSGDVILDGGGA